MKAKSEKTHGKRKYSFVIVIVIFVSAGFILPGGCETPSGNGTGTSDWNGVFDNDTDRIIAVLAGQDGIFGPRHLHNSLHDEDWMNDRNNVVGLFEEDADWTPLNNATLWIKDKVNNYPNASVIIVGRSNGADGARKVADSLCNDNI